MHPTPHTSRHKWRREKFWTFLLLGLNRTLYQDFLPPWGFEFLLRINTQAWWYYSHYGFGSRSETPYPQAEDEVPLDDDLSVDDRPDGQDPSHGFEEQQDKPEKDDSSDGLEQTRNEGGHPTTSSSCKASDQNDASCIYKSASTERSWSFFSGRQVHCSLCCTGGCGDADVCYLQCSCCKVETKVERLLPRFDWEDVDHGQDFLDLL